mmetsp:Transcript_16966/g.31937  ORF Transcript_16966/g.31937 Transcript_16966/m.31937 type:complete len:221 (+) Transcript_16966:3-665(+)
MVHDSRWCDMHTHPSVGSENITEMSAVSCRGDGDVSWLTADVSKGEVNENHREGDNVEDFIKSWQRGSSSGHNNDQDESCASDSDIAAESAGVTWLPQCWPWYMWEAHFLPQTHWLNDQGARRSQVVLVRYTSNSEEFAERIHNALLNLGVKLPQRIEKIRVRNKSQNVVGSKHDDQLSNSLSEASVQWLRDDAFEGDYLLWAEAEAQARSGQGPWKAVF